MSTVPQGGTTPGAAVADKTTMADAARARPGSLGSPGTASPGAPGRPGRLRARAAVSGADETPARLGPGGDSTRSWARAGSGACWTSSASGERIAGLVAGMIIEAIAPKPPQHDRNTDLECRHHGPATWRRRSDEGVLCGLPARCVRAGDPQPRHLPELEMVTAGALQPGSLSPASSRLPGLAALAAAERHRPLA